VTADIRDFDDTFDDGSSALTQLRAYLAQLDLPENTRLPAERELVEILGVSRGELRKSLAVLEKEGEVWRHVGKGTFVGGRPVDVATSIAAIADRTNPAEVMRTRLLIEPEIARDAALNATREDIENMRLCLSGSINAESWRQYEYWDNRLHRTLAQATHNTLLLALFDKLNAVRRTVVWSRRRDAAGRPPATHHSFAEHDAVVQAIVERDHNEAALSMRRHLSTVQHNLLAIRAASE
jgi:DNA-binding FadR family transcriptional regulator